MQTMARANFTLPWDLYSDLKEQVSTRQRSRFVAMAVGKQLKLKKKKVSYADALRKFTGVLGVRNRPGWENLENIVNWVNEGRAAANRDYSYIPYAKTKGKR